MQEESFIDSCSVSVQDPASSLLCPPSFTLPGTVKQQDSYHSKLRKLPINGDVNLTGEKE